jgi:hypothetical protein
MPTRIVFGSEERLVVSNDPAEVAEKLQGGWTEFETMKGMKVSVNPEQVRYVQEAPSAGTAQEDEK